MVWGPESRTTKRLFRCCAWTNNKYKLGSSSRNGKGAILRNWQEKTSSLDNLVDMEVWQLRIKDHRTSEFWEREGDGEGERERGRRNDCVICGAYKDFSPISSFSNKEMESND